MKHNLGFRPVNAGDYPLIMAWRSNPLVYQHYYQQDAPLVWGEHLEWWESRNEDWMAWMVLYGTDGSWRPVGVLSIGQLDSWQPDIGIFVGEVTLWGTGVGKDILSFGTQYLMAHKYHSARATIKPDNIGSIKIFEYFMFERVCESRNGEDLYIARW